MKRKNIVLLCLVSLAGASPIVELTIQERAGVDRAGEPVLMGVPLPEGFFMSDSSLFTLRDSSGAIIPCEFRVASRWLRNRSAIRWLHLDFQADIRANQVRKATLHSESTPYSAASKLAVADRTAYWEVNTGKIRFYVKKANFNIIDQAWVDESGAENYTAANQVVASHAMGLVHKNGTREYFSGNDSASTVVVERKGPMALVLKAMGQLKDAPGAGSLHFISRIYAYNNSVVVKLENTVEYHNDVQTAYMNISDLSVVLPLSLDAARTAVMGKPGGHEETTLTAAESVSCLSQRTMGGFTGVEAVLGGKLSGTFNAKALKSRDLGWASLRDSGRGCIMAMKDFWQLFPACIEAWDIGRLLGHIYSEKPGIPVSLFAGESRTQTTRLVFFNHKTAAEQRGLAMGANNPLFAVAPPAWYCRYTHGICPLSERDDAVILPQYLSAIKTLEGKIDAKWTEAAQAVEGLLGTDGYGFMGYGDGMNKVWGALDNPWNLCWNGNYYDLPHMAFQHFVRTGDPKFLDLAIAHANMVEDVQMCHFGTGNSKTGANRYCPPTNHVAWEQETLAHVEDHPSHHKTQSLFDNWWLTGDPRALETALEGCDWLYQFAYSLALGDNIATYTRRISHLIHSLTFGYYQTRNPRYLSQLLYNWLYLQRDIQQNVAMGADWQNGFLMEALANLYYLLDDEYTNPSGANYTLKDSLLIYYKMYADRKYGLSNTNAVIGYAFLSQRYGSSYLSMAGSKMASFPPYEDFMLRDFAETGRSLEMAMYYFMKPESMAVQAENTAPLAARGLPVMASPNPFYPAVKITLKDAPASVSIYSIAGRKVYGLKSAANSFTWDASGLPSGIYLLKVARDQMALTKKLLLQK